MNLRKRHRLTASQREDLYDYEVVKALATGRGQFPICAICDCPIFPGQRWHESHNKFLPHAIGGEPDGIRCARTKNHRPSFGFSTAIERRRS